MITELRERRHLRANHEQAAEAAAPARQDQLVAFVAYGEDCVVRGEATLAGDRLTDMLNDHHEYLLTAVTVDSFVSDRPLVVAEIVIPRDEILLVHAMGPRGSVGRRHHTTPQRLAIRLGPYEVLGSFHALPGADPVAAFRRRKSMVPITDARIGYAVRGTWHETRVETLIVNREQVDWVGLVVDDEVEMPATPTNAKVGRLLKDLTGHLFEVRSAQSAPTEDPPIS